MEEYLRLAKARHEAMTPLFSSTQWDEYDALDRACDAAWLAQHALEQQYRLAKETHQ